jgi:hypothetical protein
MQSRTINALGILIFWNAETWLLPPSLHRQAPDLNNPMLHMAASQGAQFFDQGQKMISSNVGPPLLTALTAMTKDYQSVTSVLENEGGGERRREAKREIKREEREM